MYTDTFYCSAERELDAKLQNDISRRLEAVNVTADTSRLSSKRSLRTVVGGAPSATVRMGCVAPNGARNVATWPAVVKTMLLALTDALIVKRPLLKAEPLASSS